jgi:copper transport protein
MRLMKLSSIALTGLVVLVGLLIPPRAFAHAKLIRSSPDGSQALAEPPASVELWFNERLEDEFNSIQVVDSAGRRVEDGDARVHPQDRTRLVIRLSRLIQGQYVVHWRIFSVDGHSAKGRFTFSVK